MLERFELLVGDKIEKVKNKHILILGLGGVGGYACETICRCGISQLTIVDSDIIDESNLNRQLIATIDTIGMYKTDAYEKRLKSINPNIKINKITDYITEDKIPQIIPSDIDYVVDCCDSIKTKEALISYCTNNNIKFISVMGTGNKLHPEKLKIMKLKDTSYDPIAKKLRKYVKDKKISKDIYVVCSTEEKIVSNTSVIPSNSFVPSVAGILCTSYIINDILNGDL